MITFNQKNEQADQDDGQQNRGFEMLGYALIYCAALLAFPVGCTLTVIASWLP